MDRPRDGRVSLLPKKSMYYLCILADEQMYATSQKGSSSSFGLMLTFYFVFSRDEVLNIVYF